MRKSNTVVVDPQKYSGEGHIMIIKKPSWVNHEGHPIFSIDIHPDGTRVVTGGQGGSGTEGKVVIWNMSPILGNANDDVGDGDKQERVLCMLSQHLACVNAVRWSNSGHYLSSGGGDHVVIIWRLVSKYPECSRPALEHQRHSLEEENLEMWKNCWMLRGHTGDILDLAWSPDDKYLASASVDCKVYIWNAQKFPQVVTVINGHNGFVKGVTWDPIGIYLATQSDDKTLKIWRVGDWEMEHSVEAPFKECGQSTHFLRLDWSPDGAQLLSAHAMNNGGPTAQLIDRSTNWTTNKDLAGHRQAIVCVKFARRLMKMAQDPKSLCSYIAVGSKDKTISIWCTALKRPFLVFHDLFANTAVDISWTLCGTVMMACSMDGTVVMVKFSQEEIGISATVEENDAVLTKLYGTTFSNRRQQSEIITSMSAFLARTRLGVTAWNCKNSSETEESSTTHTSFVNQQIKDKAVVTSGKPRVSMVSSLSSATLMNGSATEQVEKKAAGVKKRITPVLLANNAEDSGMVQQQNDNKTDSGHKKTTSMVFSLCQTVEATIKDVNHEEMKTSENQVAAVTSTTLQNLPAANDLVNSKLVDRLMQQKPEPESNGKSESYSMEHATISESDIIPGKNQNCDISRIPVKRIRLSNPQQRVGPSKIWSDNCLSRLDEFSRPRVCDQSRPLSNPISLLTRPKNTVVEVPKSVDQQKPETLPRMIANKVLNLLVEISPNCSYSLEVKNHHKRSDGLCHQLSCFHSNSSLNALQWTVCTDTPICGIAGSQYRIVAICEDSTVHILDIKGRYALPPMVLPGHPSKMTLQGSFLVVVTSNALIDVWNIHDKKKLMKAESLETVLQSYAATSNETRVVDIARIDVSPMGVPEIVLSTGKTFLWSKELETWYLLSDPRGIVSAIATTHDTISTVGLRGITEPAVISSIKLKLAISMEKGKQFEVVQWMIALAKALANSGLEKELRCFLDDLMGPVHSASAFTASWKSKILNTIDKRSLLRRILDLLVQDLRNQHIFEEYNEMLSGVEADDIQ